MMFPFEMYTFIMSQDINYSLSGIHDPYIGLVQLLKQDKGPGRLLSCDVKIAQDTIERHLNGLLMRVL